MSKNDVKSSIPVFRATVLVLVDALLIWIVRGPLAKAPPLQGFGGFYLLTIGLPIALHISWNVFGSRVFSLAGNPLKSVAFLATEMTGPGVWVGLPHSDFGPEVGLLGVLAMLLGTLLLLKIWRRVSRADARHSRR